MTIDLKHSIILQNQIKNAVTRLSKSVISEIDKDQELHIGKRGFEINYKNDKKYRVVLAIEEI